VATRASGYVEPPHDHVATSHRPAPRRHGGDARVAMRASGGQMIVWPRPAARVTPARRRRTCGDARLGWPHDRVATSSRPLSPPCAASLGCPGQVERPGARAPRGVAVVRAPWSAPMLAALIRPVERASGLVGGRRAGAKPRGHDGAMSARSDVPRSDVLGPSARTSEHRRYSAGQGALGGLPTDDRAHTGRCGQTNGTPIGTVLGTPAYRSPGARSGAAAQ
jgi:hypothetical protein